MNINQIKMLILVCISTCVVFGQYTEGNTIVTLSKYYLKPWRTVENGDWKEREKLFDEHRKKMVSRDNLLISSHILYHYLSGNSSEVVVMNEWKNFMDADNSIRSTADRRKKGWPNKKTREKFQKRFGEYWFGGHSDMGNYELNKKMLKRRNKKMKENTIITIQEFTLAPLSEIDGGTSEDRDKIMQEWFDKVVMKDDRVLSHMMLTHYWSGSAGGSKGWPVVFVNEYANMDDLLDEDISKLLEAGWPDEKERKTFQDKHRAYWSHYKHDDIGIYNNNVKQQKLAK
jgi:hypothetical protein